jgi:transposase-like protein
MLIHLHKQATTTPKVRAAIQASDEAGTVLAERFGVTPQTIYKWRKRDSVADRSHTPHRLQTTLTLAQEAVAVALRRALLISLDDLLAVVREFLNPDASRSGLDRCLRRHGVGNLRDLQAKAARPKHSAFKAYEPGYIHIDGKYLPHPLGPLLRNALPGNEWLMKTAADTSSWQSTGRRGGCSSASSRQRQRPMRAASCVI